MTRANKPHPGHRICTQDKHQFKQIHQYDTQLRAYRHHTAYETLIEEYYDELVQIEDYFRDADKDLVVALIDDKTCKMVRVETAKEKEDRKTFADPCISTPNILSRPAALTHLAALPNFKNIDGESRERVCDLFDSLSTAHSTIADVAQNISALGRQLDPDQFGFILKHSVRPLVQLQIPPGLCSLTDLKFAKANLTPEEEYDERGVNTTLPRPHHPDLATVKDKHPTRALTVAIHYHLRKRMYPHFPASQTEIADLFAVEWKKFFTSVTGREYEGCQKLSKVRKLDLDKPPDTKGDKDKENNASPAKQEQPISANDDQEIDPEMPELEDVEPWKPKKFHFKKPHPAQGRKHFPKK